MKLSYKMVVEMENQFTDLYEFGKLFNRVRDAIVADVGRIMIRGVIASHANSILTTTAELIEEKDESVILSGSNCSVTIIAQGSKH